MNIPLIILAAIVHVLITALISIRGWYLYKKFNYPINLKILTEILIIVSAANAISPFRMAGVFVKTFILKKKYDIPHKINLTIIAIEQLMELIMQTIVVVLCIYIIGWDGTDNQTSLTSKIIISSLALIVLFALFFWSGLGDLINKIINITEKITPIRLIEFIKKKSKVKRAYFTDVLRIIQDREDKTSIIIWLILITLFIYAIFPLSFYIFLKGMGLSLTLTQIFVVFWLPMILGKVSGIPGGIGVRDSSMIYLLTTMNITLKEATAVTVSFRLMTIIVISFVAAILSAKYGLNIFKLHKLKKANENTEEAKDKN